jgi:hypothetical protein
MQNTKTLFRQFRKLIAPNLAAVLLIGCIPAAAQEHTFDIQTHVNSAEVIVVGLVQTRFQAGTGEMEIRGRNFTSRVFQAELRVDRVLKGRSVPRQLRLSFETPVSPAGSLGYKGLVAQSYVLVFLKRTERQFALANPFLPSFPAVPHVQDAPSADPLAAVLHELDSVIESPVIAAPEKIGLIYRLGATPSEVAAAILRQHLESKDVSIRASVVAALLEQRDLAALAVAEKLLLKPPEDIPKYLITNISSAIARYVTDDAAIPPLRRLLAAADAHTRRAAALALRNTQSPRALPSLVLALDDSDQEVRYYAVIGLAEITGDSEWRPLMDEFGTEEATYISHWRQWAAANVSE